MFKVKHLAALIVLGAAALTATVLISGAHSSRSESAPRTRQAPLTLAGALAVSRAQQRVIITQQTSNGPKGQSMIVLDRTTDYLAVYHASELTALTLGDDSYGLDSAKGCYLHTHGVAPPTLTSLLPSYLPPSGAAAPAPRRPGLSAAPSVSYTFTRERAGASVSWRAMSGSTLTEAGSARLDDLGRLVSASVGERFPLLAGFAYPASVAHHAAPSNVCPGS